MARFSRRREDATPGSEDNAALRGSGGYEPEDAPRAQPKRIRPRPKPLKWRRAPWFGLAFIALVAGVLNALGVGKPHPAPSSPPPSEPVVTPSARVAVPPVVVGWQSVTGGDGAYAYDVPPSWQPDPDTQQSWGGPGIKLITSAFLGKYSCGTSVLGGAGVATEPLEDPEAAARKAAADVTAGAYGGTPQVGPAMDVRVTKADGTAVPAWIVFAEVVPTHTGGCVAKHAMVVAMGFGNGSGASGVMVAYADTDRSGPSVRDDLVRIVRSYRFVPPKGRVTIPPPPTTTFR